MCDGVEVPLFFEVTDYDRHDADTTKSVCEASITLPDHGIDWRRKPVAVKASSEGTERSELVVIDECSDRIPWDLAGILERVKYILTGRIDRKSFAKGVELLL